MSIFSFQYILSLATIIIVCLTASHGMPYNNGHGPNVNQNRNFIQFGNMILSASGNPFGYNGYGCWCGKGNRGDLVVDETDRCCQLHDECWSAVKINHGCDPFWTSYDYKTSSNHTVQCTDPIKTCDYHSCQCDKAAVECFARHRNKSYNLDFDNWEGLCTIAVKSPENDLETCPPIWNAREKYTSGNLVSIHGIVYQSLFTNGPGQNPLNHLVSSHYHGIIATWKKLDRCRRTTLADLF